MVVHCESPREKSAGLGQEMEARALVLAKGERCFFRCGTCVDQAQVNGACLVEGLGKDGGKRRRAG